MSGLTSITDYADAADAGNFDGSSGFRYVQRKGTMQKDAARSRLHGHIKTLVDDRGRRDKQSLSILTMPSVKWSFERSLISNREHGRGKIRPRRTYITAIESNPAVYRAAVLTMPGLDTGLVTFDTMPPWSKMTVQTYSITRFHLCSFEDLAWGTAEDMTPWKWDMAWIDLCGQVSVRRLDALSCLWQRIRTALIVTSLRGRWEQGLNEQVAALGLAGVFRRWMPDSLVLDDHSYADRAPMQQIALIRETS